MATPTGKTFTDDTVAAELANAEAQTASANTAAGRANSAADRLEANEDDAYNHAQATSSFTGLTDAVLYAKGAKGWQIDAAADGDRAEDARDDAQAARDDASESEARAAASAALVAPTLIYAKVDTYDDLPTATNTGRLYWVLEWGTAYEDTGTWTYRGVLSRQSAASPTAAKSRYGGSGAVLDVAGPAAGLLGWSATNPFGATGLDVLAYEIASNGGLYGYWLRPYYGGDIDAAWAGMSPAASASANAAALLAAVTCAKTGVNTFSAGGRATVKLGPYKYAMEPVNLLDLNAHIVGSGVRLNGKKDFGANPGQHLSGTILDYSGSVSASPALTIGTTTGRGADRLEGFALLGKDSGTTTGLHVTRGIDVVATSVYVAGFFLGRYFDNMQGGLFSNCFTIGCVTGTQLATTTNNCTFINDATMNCRYGHHHTGGDVNTFLGGVVQGTGFNVGVWFQAGGSNTEYHATYFEAEFDTAPTPGPTILVEGVGSNRALFFKCHFSSNNGGIRVAGGDAARFLYCRSAGTVKVRVDSASTRALFEGCAGFAADPVTTIENHAGGTVACGVYSASARFDISDIVPEMGRTLAFVEKGVSQATSPYQFDRNVNTPAKAFLQFLNMDAGATNDTYLMRFTNQDGTAAGGWRVRGSTNAFHVLEDSASAERVRFAISTGGGEVWIDGVKVLDGQGAAVADIATADATDLASAIALVNALKADNTVLKARLRAHGLIAT